MIGSPDLVAFTRQEAYEEQTTPALPEEYSVPLFPFSDTESSPWSRLSGAKFSRDFILISEFSEQVGPQPLLTIPDDHDNKVCGTFDLNYFSLRIMSVDYQASFVGHPPGSSYPKLNFVEDSKVVLGDSKEGAFTYVHHLTLYDLEARGFVRPFCIAYISTDEDKIMQQFIELSSDFSKASECLKIGNRKAFAHELEKKLKDLDYTRTVLQMQMEDLMKMDDKGFYSTQAIEKANELANVEKSIIEHNDLLKQIQSYPYRKLKGDDFQPYEPETLQDEGVFNGSVQPSVSSDPDENVLEEETNVCPTRSTYTPKFIKAKSAKCFDKKLKTLEELVDLYFFTQTLDLLTSIEKKYRGDVSYLLMGNLDKALLKQQAITNFLFEDLSPWDARSSVKHYNDNLEASQSFLSPKPFQEPVNIKPSASFESYKSSVESVPIKMEQELSNDDCPPEEAELFVSDTQDISECLDMDMKGSVSSGESIEVLRTENSVSLLTHSESQPCIRLHSSPLVPRKKASSRRTISEDSIEVLSTCTSETVIPEDFRAYQIVINEEEPSTEDMKEQQCSLIDNDDNAHGNREVPINDSSVEPACCIGAESSSLVEHTGNLTLDSSGYGTVVSVPPQPFRNNDQSFQVKFNVDEIECQSDDQAFHRISVSEQDSGYLMSSGEAGRINFEEHSDSTSYRSSASTCSDRTPSPFYCSSNLSEKHKKKAGQNALRFIRQYPFSHPAIYSLLTGRTLVIIGEDEALVKKLVTALSIFVPNSGNVAKPVKLWVSPPLHILDFQKWKLIGLQRVASPSGSIMLQSLMRYSRYASVLDADNKTLRCPIYKGTLLQRMADHRTQIRRGSTYYMHVQSMLTQLSSKAFLFTFCRHLHFPIREDESEESISQRQAAFLHHLLGLSQEDSKIVEYLSELLKMHYLRELGTQVLPVLRFDYVPSFLYKI
ncbi:guanine nucleotide exchange protein SMCR8 [Bombina bombina]|uniref:guanine nucleotide exchange protein SMCR8 n=1 Tax=Bombina bombina TaxID=8345 RepID=UPI00235A8585|nr:guanine nucleotide exchange protein SMCR8 [Bombina bombina]